MTTQTQAILFSIIIPVYNVEKYLRQCLDSVFSQNFISFEVICVNDGSTDGSLAILEEYRIKHNSLIILNLTNGGTAWARNHGLKQAKGDYIWFVDSDDWINTESLKILSSYIYDEPDILCFNGKLLYEQDGREKTDPPIVDKDMTGWEYYNKYALLPRNFHFVCVVLRLYKRTFLIGNNLFFEKEISHEDNLWTPVTLYYAQKLRTCSENLYIYRIREGSKMQSTNEIKTFDIIKVANKLADFFIPTIHINKTTIYREIAGEYFKGFMPDEIKKYGNNDQELIQTINWKHFKIVSVYPRHRRIYRLLSISPTLFRLYIKVESILKKHK